MYKMLSESEIDKLLSSISTGSKLKKEDQAKKINVYDFKKALRFSKDQVQRLFKIHENYARLLTSYLSNHLRTDVHINVASVEQLPYEEFVRSIPSMTILNIFESPPLKGKMAVEVNPNVAYAMLDRLLGGLGAGINKADNLTEIETKLMNKLFDKCLILLKEAWAAIDDIEPKLLDLETNPHFMQLVSPNETVIVISLETTISEVSGMINICFPYVPLEEILQKLSAQDDLNEKKVEYSQEDRRSLAHSIKKSLLPVVSELGQSEMTVKEFLDLNVGDVIMLKQKVTDPNIIKVGGYPKFYGQFGKRSQRLAVQILNTFDEGDESDE
ncbi:flagellar motor switch protein FliM [Scopulibacillus daqui]|uniref:Flagellar motor switch protein FliM n=2 Tax=Scopulibacillus daqui TaxID=1469162 RepID=A0ABS2PXD0_9BACL|nr:flagellar motor switch protein FliM [Scopulibacillus daqui]